MILKRMTATFGRLDKETLELHEGLNIVTAPNEAGKSTWASFLLSMLYGVDTSERATKTNLPVKTRCKPWSGRPMEGSMELQWNGRSITLERATQGRVPMGQFRAYDTETGRDVPLSEADCGQTLLGVERSVYERSGFIRQQGMAVTGDHALEARLSALVTTGDETASFGLAEQRLRDLRNRCRHNRTGLLPQAEAELSQVEASLRDLQQLGKERMELEARRAELEVREAALSNQLDSLAAREVAQKQQQLEQARLDLEKKEQSLREKEETVEGLPSMEALQELQRQLDVLAGTGRQLEEDLRLGVLRPKEPECPPVFAGMDADQVRECAEADCRRLDSLRRPPQYASGLPVVCFALAAVFFVAGIAGFLLHLLPLGAVGMVACVAAAVLGAVRRARNGRSLNAQTELLRRYGVTDGDGIRRLAAGRRESMLLYQQRLREAEMREQSLRERSEAFAAQRQALLAQVAAFTPDAATPSAAGAAVQRAIHLRQFHTAAKREAEQARLRFASVRDAVGTLPETPVLVSGDLTGDAGQVSAELSQVRRKLQEVRSQLDLRRGRMESVGDPAALSARQEELTGHIARLQRRYDALTAAMDALAQANESLQTRFSPQINRLAGEYMARMTGGRYDRVLLGQDMTITARETGEAVTHPLLALSAGTADQLYLAVRLAVCALALPEDVPLVLDDALVAFDDTRMAAAMELLLELSKTRQILLFTCQRREQAWLDGHKKEAADA